MQTQRLKALEFNTNAVLFLEADNIPAAMRCLQKGLEEMNQVWRQISNVSTVGIFVATSELPSTVRASSRGSRSLSEAPIVIDASSTGQENLDRRDLLIEAASILSNFGLCWKLKAKGTSSSVLKRRCGDNALNLFFSAYQMLATYGRIDGIELEGERKATAKSLAIVILNNILSILSQHGRVREAMEVAQMVRDLEAITTGDHFNDEEVDEWAEHAPAA